MANGLLDQRFLSSAHIQIILEKAESYLARTKPLTFLDRLQLVNATDFDIMGRFVGRVVAADLIADGQKAMVHEADRLELVTNALCNIKIGKNLNQAQINSIEALSAGIGRATEEDAWFNWQQSLGENLLQGVRDRMNAMACGMMLDDFDYNRFGLKLTDLSWGMPSALKQTPSVLWSLDGGTTPNTANGDPIADVYALDEADRLTYGLGPFDRMTMSTAAFNIMVSLTKFANRAWQVFGASFNLTPANLKTNSQSDNMEIARKIFMKDIVIDDKMITEIKNDGSPNTYRVLPANKILLDRKSNSKSEWDFGNAVVTESIVSKLMGGASILGANPKLNIGGAYGPLGFFTSQTHDMNPPGINGWAVARGFPRKHVPEASAVLTVY